MHGIKRVIMTGCMIINIHVHINDVSGAYAGEIQGCSGDRLSNK